jgi:hypothetical protein
VLPWKFLLLHNVFVRYIGLNKTHVFVRYIGLNKTQENRFIINIIQSCYVVLSYTLLQWLVGIHQTIQ